MSKTYKVRYMFEHGEFSPQSGSDRIMPGMRVSHDEYGYTDRFLVASIIACTDGTWSVALVSPEGGLCPSREILELVRDQIDHHLEHHCQD